MKQISQEEANKIIEQGEKEMKQMIDDGGKITKTTIEEKNKKTIIIKMEPVDGKPTSSKIVTTKDGITIDYL